MDSACGTGNLLAAVTTLHPHMRIAGMDRDRSAIVTLRRQRPGWNLSVADVLCDRSIGRADVVATRAPTTAMVLNPPFSMGASAGLPAVLNEKPTRVSAAMAHVLRSVEMFDPDTVVALVPESLLHADRDEVARHYLASRYVVRELYGLKNTTFSGARVNSVVIRLSRGATKVPSQKIPLGAGPTLVRGGLPMFQALRVARGMPFIHSTDIGRLIEGHSLTKLARVAPIERGQVSGHVILLPRVGLPSHDWLRPMHLPRTVQLSDCVLGIEFSSHRAAARFADVARDGFTALVAQYRGTGARYTTVSKILSWASDVWAAHEQAPRKKPHRRA